MPIPLTRKLEYPEYSCKRFAPDRFLFHTPSGASEVAVMLPEESGGCVAGMREV